MGNLCAPWHQVHHVGGPGSAAEPLYRGVASTQDVPVHVTCMLRTDVFRAARARTLDSAPGSAELFQIVNTETAKHLAEEPFRLPGMGDVLADADTRAN